jgi:hypothetical protein
VIGFLRVFLPYAATDMRATPDRLHGLPEQRYFLCSRIWALDDAARHY